MKKSFVWICVALFAAMMSLPWLVPHAGWLALVGFLPLLLADDFADHMGVRRFWWCHYTAFVLWNAFTTFWVCNATIGGGIFAVLCNALQMSVIWAMFRLSKKRLSGAVPYIFLAVMWIAWEKAYFSAQISWPWLTLGNAFARSTHLVQWYDTVGSLGGSLWVWASNLGLYGMISAQGDGRWRLWNPVARCASVAAMLLVLVVPAGISHVKYHRYEEKSEGQLSVLIGQPNFDPYEKFSSMSQAEQTKVLTDLYEEELAPDTDLLIAPETFTSDIYVNDVLRSPTVASFMEFLGRHKDTRLLFGASTWDLYQQNAAPSILARPLGDACWLESHNSALMLNAEGEYDIFHKSKLVVGTELTPYPEVFVPLDNRLSKMMGVNSLMGRCVGQKEISLLNYDASTPVGCAVCYESVYGEYCTGYVRKGAKLMTVITNDAWWGDTPGYRQHLSYSRLRAIELRRDIARCGNTGISAIIDQKGDIVSQTPWWTRTTLSGEVNLSSGQTPFVRYGDIVGRVCTLAFLLLSALLLVRLIVRK